jgi:hypothetical protein
MNHSHLEFYEIFTPGKDLKWGHSRNSGLTLDSSYLVSGSHSYNIPVLDPYPTHRSWGIGGEGNFSMNHTHLKFYKIFTPGKDLKWGHSGNSGPMIDCLVPGPHSKNIPVLDPYPTHRSWDVGGGGILGQLLKSGKDLTLALMGSYAYFGV